MNWTTPLQDAVILSRYKRFLADVELEGEKLTVHVPNTGSMLGCWAPGWRCALSKSENPERKLPYTLELTHNGESWIGVNTANANRLARHWLEQGLLPEFSDYKIVRPEFKVGDSRVDFLLKREDGGPDCFVEVKSVTLKHEGQAQFPDAVSERGQKHLRELIRLRREGHASAMLFVVQREDVEVFAPAAGIDPTYARLLREAADAGVEISVHQCRIGLDAVTLGPKLPLQLD
jgi:sugar fermentation stimulation protein A